jgi:hypothetical protein
MTGNAFQRAPCRLKDHTPLRGQEEWIKSPACGTGSCLERGRGFEPGRGGNMAKTGKGQNLLWPWEIPFSYLLTFYPGQWDQT